MSEIVKSLMELVKGQKASSDLLYRWLACAAAMLTIAAYMRHQRPSDVLADMMLILNFESASAWFTTGLPPVFALSNQTAQHIVLAIAEILVMAMLFLPFVVAQKEERLVGWQALGLLGARAPSTIWILLVLASQLGPLNCSAIWQLSTGILLFMAALIIAGMLCLSARLFHFQNPLASGFRKFSPIVCDAIKVVFMTIISFAFAAIAPLVEMVVWMGFIESDSFFEANLRFEKEK